MLAEKIATLNINVPVDKDVHTKLRQAIFPRSYSDWLRQAEREALVGLIKNGKRK